MTIMEKEEGMSKSKAMFFQKECGGGDVKRSTSYSIRTICDIVINNDNSSNMNRTSTSSISRCSAAEIKRGSKITVMIQFKERSHVRRFSFAMS
ncbi:hypothetical protein CHS0354_000903 [Potamilus streckersoni]|uniref:Uncharacterized protein n=1 Tax=Potamilus streckersoni TaxID=2493646 RepID=A0AAE0VQ23_9BIVA|nr:hypothetical protein CHS0354_000903 [Potamilus streckersoni]